MSILDYILNVHSSKEGYWGCQGNGADPFKPVVEEIYKLHEINSMLEIGFNIGCSATMWLEWHPTKSNKLVSIDICNHKDTLAAVETVKARYGDRFEFIKTSSLEARDLLEGYKFDAAFIDGDHSAYTVRSDTLLALSLGANLLIYDDYHDRDKEGSHTNGVKAAVDDLVKEGKISPVKIIHFSDSKTPIASQVGVFRRK